MEDCIGSFIGIDLGKRSMTVHFIRPDNRHESWTCKTDVEGRLRLMKKLKSQDFIAMEACPLAFILYSLIRKEVGATVFVLNPYGLAVIYRSTKKTDREDAAKLAWVIQRFPEEELPSVAIPSEEEQELRCLVSEQVGLTQSRTKEINRLHALFVQAGITTVTKKDLSCSKNRKILYPQITTALRVRAERYERVVSSYEQNLAEVDFLIKGLVAKHELTPYLMSMPGVGPSLVATFLGFIGDGKRFRRDTITAYAGLVPRVDCSGDMKRYGSITKQGCPLLRRALTQGAWGLVRSADGGVLQKKYYQWKETKGNSKAIVALSRKMLETLWILATKKALYINCDTITVKKKLERYSVKYEVGELGVA